MSTPRSPSVVCPTLIGRTTQLTSLTNLMTQAGDGQSRIALIAGEAGVGKSRLVAELKAIARQRHAGIMQGRCFEQDRIFPYAPVLDLLRAFCVGRSAAEIGCMLGATASELVKLLPELATLLPNLTPTPAYEPEQEKRGLFHALTQFLQQRTTAPAPPPGRPLLVIFEDLHWADDTSLEWLLYLARQLEKQPLLVLLTYRQDEIQPSLHQLLAALDRIPFVSELVLTRLTSADVDAMLQTIFNLSQSPRAEFLDALYALTEGNPFFNEEVLKSLIAAGDIYQEGGEWTRKPLRELQIPRTVQVAVQQRTRQLSQPAQRLLTFAAVAGQRFDFVVLQAITQQAEHELLSQVKELLAAQLVVEESDETFAFRHALTRQALYTALLARERKTLHRMVAEAMEHCYVGSGQVLHVSELANQFYEAGLWAKAMEWSRRAGANAERLYAYGEALSHYTRARQCAERLGQPDQVAVADQVIGLVHYARNEFPQALDYYQRALQATGNPARRAALKAQMGATYANIADERGLVFLHAALNELEPTTQAQEVALATLWLGRHYHYLAQYTLALTYLQRARQLLEPLDDVAALRFVYAFIAGALTCLAHFEQSSEWAWRCIALGEAKHYVPAVVIGYYQLSINAEAQGRWQEMAEFANRGRQFVGQSEWPREELWIALQCVRAAYYQADLTTGAQSARACVALALELHGHRSLVRARETLALFETALGNEEVAHALGETAVRAADTLLEVTARCTSRLALAGLSMQRTEWMQATELYEQCIALMRATENRLVQMELGALLAEAYCAQGRLAEATHLIAETLTQADARRSAALAWRVQGQICAAQGRNDAAAQAFQEAIDLCEASGSQLELARTLYHRGALHQTRQALESAHADWLRARNLCEQIGARALLWCIHAVLGQLALARQHGAEAERAFAAARTIVEELAAAMLDESFRQSLWRRAAVLIPAEPLVPSRRAIQAEFGGLTTRERAVVVLIAQGKSNREIAETLVVSERTVTTHVSNIFAKLGFVARAQVAAWAGEKGIATPNTGD